VGLSFCPLGNLMNLPVFACELPGYPSFPRIIEADRGPAAFIYLESGETSRGFYKHAFPVLQGPSPSASWLHSSPPHHP